MMPGDVVVPLSEAVSNDERVSESRSESRRRVNSMKIERSEL